ncbi:hypothetical protein JTE90_015209 [Oedothorax gibbosus]|uniref:Uncharacterized protein n=1 Tax=Oedothorax gibbosus TaxID=931172 RepID=A0AAV6V9F8_9ARAC|nr:hypothetical protein JTE90_015209 [Oedothorax gibbosus]
MLPFLVNSRVSIEEESSEGAIHSKNVVQMEDITSPLVKQIFDSMAYSGRELHKSIRNEAHKEKDRNNRL